MHPDVKIYVARYSIVSELQQKNQRISKSWPWNEVQGYRRFSWSSKIYFLLSTCRRTLYNASNVLRSWSKNSEIVKRFVPVYHFTAFDHHTFTYTFRLKAVKRHFADITDYCVVRVRQMGSLSCRYISPNRYYKRTVLIMSRCRYWKFNFNVDISDTVTASTNVLDDDIYRCCWCSPIEWRQCECCIT